MQVAYCAQAKIPEVPLPSSSPSLPFPTVESDSANLPFLIHSLLGHDRELRSIVSTHVRWLERLLAAYEVYARCRTEDKQTESDLEAGYAYSPQRVWRPEANISELPLGGEGLHCALPALCPCFEEEYSSDIPRSRYMAPLFHFANYFFPIFTVRGRAENYMGSSPLSPSQLAAIAHVNNFLKTR